MVYRLFVLCFCLISSYSYAQHMVSFGVSVGAGATFDSIDVTGNFISLTGGTDWVQGIRLKDPDFDGIYRGTVMLFDGSYEAQFRIINGSTKNWEGAIPAACATNGNRGFTVAGADVNVGPFLFGTCSISIPSSLESNIDYPKVMFSLYPNPTKDNAIVRFLDNQLEHHLIIQDIHGKVVLTAASILGEQYTISQNEFYSGLYFVTITDEKGYRATTKLYFD